MRFRAKPRIAWQSWSAWHVPRVQLPWPPLQQRATRQLLGKNQVTSVKSWHPIQRIPRKCYFGYRIHRIPTNFGTETHQKPTKTHSACGELRGLARMDGRRWRRDRRGRRGRRRRRPRCNEAKSQETTETQDTQGEDHHRLDHGPEFWQNNKHMFCP